MLHWKLLLPSFLPFLANTYRLGILFSTYYVYMREREKRKKKQGHTAKQDKSGMLIQTLGSGPRHGPCHARPVPDCQPSPSPAQQKQKQNRLRLKMQIPQLNSNLNYFFFLDVREVLGRREREPPPPKKRGLILSCSSTKHLVQSKSVVN